MPHVSKNVISLSVTLKIAFSRSNLSKRSVLQREIRRFLDEHHEGRTTPLHKQAGQVWGRKRKLIASGESP